MQTMQKQVVIDSSGNVVVAVGAAEAGHSVIVTISPVPQNDQHATRVDAIRRIAGSWVGDFPEIDDQPPSPKAVF